MIKLSFYIRKNGYLREIIETEKIFSLGRLEGFISACDLEVGAGRLGAGATRLLFKGAKLKIILLRKNAKSLANRRPLWTNQ